MHGQRACGADETEPNTRSVSAPEATRERMVNWLEYTIRRDEGFDELPKYPGNKAPPGSLRDT